MRVHDVLPPPIAGGDRPGPDTPMGQWPAELFVAIEGVLYDAPQWDASPADLWDGADVEWDELGTATAAYIDAICWLHGLTIETYPPAADGTFASTFARITLDNRDGAWSRYGPAGDLLYFPPGRRVLIWADLDGEPWWLFAGKVATWRETEGRVDLEAVDAFTELNARIGEWTPGTPGQTPAERIEAVLALIGWDGPRRLDVGDVTLMAPVTSNSPLEEIQAVALSDGGAAFIDADGTVLYRDRRWVLGRDDQTGVAVISGNRPTADAVVWDLELTTDDDTLANLVTLSNLDEPTPVTVTARDASSEGRYGTFTLPENRLDDLWETEPQGQALADYLVGLRSDPLLRISTATMHLHDPQQDLWRLGIDMRRGDLLELVQEVPTTAGELTALDVFAVVSATRHEVTPSSWTVTLETSRTVGNRLVQRWDEAPYVWDEDDPANLWGF